MVMEKISGHRRRVESVIEETRKLPMDFVGQERAQRLQTRLIVAFTVAGSVLGFALQRAVLQVYFTLAGAAIATVVCVPAWPIFRQHPVKFAAPQLSEGSKPKRAKRE